MCESIFVYLKEQLQGIDLLIHPNSSKPFVLTSDASDVNDFIMKNIIEEKTWNAFNVGNVNLELTNYNVGELSDGQSKDIEIRGVINFLENQDCAGEISKCSKKHLSKLNFVNGLLCYTYHGNILVLTSKSLKEESNQIILELGHS